jgi:tetratricopeptide (TPR) repeat protein
MATDLLIYLLATIVDPRPNMPFVDPQDFSHFQNDAVLVIDAMLSRVKNRTGGLSPTQQAIKAWCVFALGAATKDRGRLAEAGAVYLSVARHPVETDALNNRSTLCRAAAARYARALQWVEAIAAAKEWCAVAPADAEAHRRLAESLYKDQRIPEAIQAYEAYVQCRKEGANDWESSLLLQLGLQFASQRQIAAALDVAAFSTTFRSQGETLVTWFSEWFPKLCAKARERWWVGMFSLSSPHVAEEIGAARWDLAADSFGEGVAFELKDRVFHPFADSHLEVKVPDRHWGNVLAGKGTLGQMIECLLQARVPVHPLARELRKWLDTNRPALPKHLSKVQPHRLLEFSTLRGQAQHGSVTETETRAVFAEAAELLRAIAGG